jgi:hypothetical protein
VNDDKPTLFRKSLVVLHITLAGIGYHLVAVLVVDLMLH